MDIDFRPFTDSIKNLPIKIGATSFIWQEGYAENVKKLRTFFDEIQLMAFEDVISSPISKKEVKTLAQLKEGIQYSLHLPAPNKMTENSDDALSPMVATIESFKPANPTVYILHLDYQKNSFNAKLVRENLSKLFSLSKIKPEQFAVENLDSNFELIWDEVKETGISISADIGHLLRDGSDPVKFIDKYREHILAFHIHGTKDGKDHLSLNQIESGLLKEIITVASSINAEGAMVIENYSPDALLQSVRYLSTIF